MAIINSLSPVCTWHSSTGSSWSDTVSAADIPLNRAKASLIQGPVLYMGAWILTWLWASQIICNLWSPERDLCWLEKWYIFSCACWPFVYLLWRNFFQILYSFFIVFFLFLLLNLRNCPYILYFNSLSDTWFANVSFHSLGCLFTTGCVLDAQTFYILV